MADQTVDLEPAFVDLEKATLEVAGDPILGDSKQDKPAREPKEAIDPPADLWALARLSATNSTRRAIIDAIARNTVGLGYTIQLADQEERDSKDDEERTKNVRLALEAAAARDVRLDRPSFTELMMAVKTDEEEVGNGYIEVSRNRLTGRIDGLFHAPAKRVRRLKDRSGFMLLSAGGGVDDAIYFSNFGEKVEYTPEGEPTTSLARGNWEMNELLPFRIYSSESRDYGLPRDVGMALEYMGDKLSAESNISFFDSSGTPPTVIFVQGDETQDGQRIKVRVPQSTVDRIAHTLKSDGGHRHRVAIIPLPSGAKTDKVELGKISDRDMGFVEFRKDIRSRQLAAYRLSPIFVSQTDDAGRYTAEVQRAISLEQVFDPEQARYENRLQQTILKDLGYPRFQIVFKRLAVEADAARRDSADKMAEAGTITRREHRKAHGYAALPEAAKSATEIEWQGGIYKSAEPEPGQVPFGWNDELINTGQPAGAENRVVEGTGQQGLRPGVGARRRRQETRAGTSASAEAGAAGLAVQTRAAGGAATNGAREAATGR
jgi:capsid portal protein